MLAQFEHDHEALNWLARLASVKCWQTVAS
jgi:hypothetical protein